MKESVLEDQLIYRWVLFVYRYELKSMLVIKIDLVDTLLALQVQIEQLYAASL